MANLYLLKYNNYNNRIVKVPYETVEQYLNNHDYMAFYSMNFNPNDRLTTNHILNMTLNDFVPDYLLVEEETGRFTRWFVTKITRTRGGQYLINLKRDVLGDFYNETREGVSFISKGFVNAENPLIFNSEGISVNQIKSKEILLKDSTAAAWVVGYLAPNLAAEGDVNISVTYEQDVVPDISEFDYIDYVGKEIKGLINEDKSFYMVRTTSNGGNFRQVKRFFNNTATGDYSFQTPTDTIYVTNANSTELINKSIQVDSNILSTIVTNISKSDFEEIMSLKDKVYYDNGVYKKVVISDINNSEEQSYEVVTNSNYPNVFQAITGAMEDAGLIVEGTRIPIRIYYSSFTLNLQEVGAPFTSANVTFKSSIKQLKDAPYKMFAIPLTPDNAILRVGNVDIPTTRDRTLQIASSIASGLKTAADGFLYDIQLLPYCPFKDLFMQTIDVSGIEYIGTGQEHIDYDIIRDNEDNIIAYMFYADRSSFTTNITGIGSLLYPPLDFNDPVDFKTQDITHEFRIVSPNFANYEDFNYYKNYGLNYFNVDCTCKPFTPYIKLNINYKGLYGGDFDDQRGLILGGDFSLPVINDNWANYQIQNKNYANIFERETQNLEYKHRWNMASTVIGAGVGTAKGGLLGSMFGMGAAGALGSAVAGVADIIGTQATFAEDMDYRRDMFEFNIQNIQALPQGIIKTSALNYNSKLFPFVEIYSSTEEEKEFVKNKIKFSGMTLNIIGSIKDYLNPSDLTYIQGRIIRMNINEDSSVAAAINTELNMGVYYE